MKIEKDPLLLLCSKINMPQKATDCILSVLDEFDFTLITKYEAMFFNTSVADEMMEKINDILKDYENKGFIWLTLYLLSALETKKIYEKKGISDEIFYDTMGVFTRFVNEHFESFGSYNYDRAFWNYRQTAMTLFRIGVLEFEMRIYSEEDAIIDEKTALKKGDNVISIHIPSDAKLSVEGCRASFKVAKDFFEKYYSGFSYDLFCCGSWLISPNLRDVLPQSSNILHFIDFFEIYKIIPDSDAYINWVFKNSKLTVDEYPQDTSLQRNIVKYIKQGKKIGAACGIIRKETI